ncbi:regulator of G-protein signaling 12 isoform X2 [Artibeus jamaicensis]|uniref:regulator of G-protein signaling 12 isoform X2 n=1 Tax=Artibeus jamaicensis TaxID=9417 RepID=UPI00235B0ECD|nr:regulator of G-protein signaling 12 isoform X2 [Artibeus jamaicensis]
MHRAGDSAERPPQGTAPPRLRSVEVARGRAGYGFTLSGQAPCVLSAVMRGSPADLVGLRAGDQILAVNDISVRKASHEDVVKLVGKCSGVLRMVVGEGRGPRECCSSDEEAGFCEGRGWRKPRLDSKALGINRAERVVADVQSGGIFSMIFENPRLRTSSDEPLKSKQRSLSESAAARLDLGHEHVSDPHPSPPPKEETSKALNEDSVFSVGLENHEDFGLDASILNVAMVVGYLGSIELPSTSCSLESDSFQAIRGCLRRLRAEQKIHSLVAMQIMHDGVRLCTDRAAVLAEYPAEKLAFSAVCPDDRRFFGLVTMQSGDDGSLAQEDEGALRTSCHVFMVDPDLFNHKIHQGIARRFGFECTADPDTNGCLEFPASSLPVLQFVSVLYRDMGELMEGVRARAFADGDADAHQNTSTSSNSDSGIGNFNQEERSSRVLVVDLGAGPSRHGPGGSTWEGAGGRGPQPWGAPWNGAFCHEAEAGPPLEAVLQADRCWDFSKHSGLTSHVGVPPASLRSLAPSPKRGAVGPGGGFGQRWLPVHVLQEWQCGHASDQESYTDSTDGWSSINCGTLPPPMSKIPADRYRVEGSSAQPPLNAQKRDWSRKAFGMPTIFGPHRSVRKTKEDKKSATVSDGELSGADLKDCVSNHSLSSNASLPSVQSCRRLRERRVASWAVSFERLLQDPLGVRYFSDFLRKEFSEENILFWQACECFSHVPAHDKKELSYRAREIFSKFLGSKATTPVNIDSQAQLADDTLSAPHPDMFKEQQLQIFNLMKFDSYTRFLKSPLYQECILAEVEGRSLPDSQQVPSSPTSKHSVSSDHSNVSTPKKLSGKSRSGRSLNEDAGDEDSERRRKGAFFSWSRARSTGRSQRKKDHGDHTNDAPQANGGLGRRESQGSVSSAGSLDLSEACRTLAPERDKATKHCCIQLPDGTSCTVPVRAGLSIKEVLSGLCERHGFSGAAVDLFLVGGDKPLVLNQDSGILASRDLRLEKRTLFRLDLVPINRSVGLKAKPTKPVTEVLRPVVAKYGLHLSELVARLNGEKEPLDLGAPISSLDGQRVVLEEKGPSGGRDKQKGAPIRQSTTGTSGSRSFSATGEERTLGKSNSIKIKGENGKNARDPRLSKREESIAKIGKKKYQKINLDEAEAFFELISKAQSNRADDQRGLLRKEDLVLPEFLRLPPGATSPSQETVPRPREPRGPAQDHLESPETSPSSADSPPFCTPTTPTPYTQEVEAGDVQTVEGEHVADLTLTGEGDISSPNSTLLPPPPAQQDSAGPPRPGGGAHGSLPISTFIDVDLVAGSAPRLGRGLPGLWAGPRRSAASRPRVSELPGRSPVPGRPTKPKASPHHATFV